MISVRSVPSVAQIRALLATLVVLVGTAVLWLYVAVSATHPLFGLVTPAVLLPVAYVVDTGTGPRVDALAHLEAAMLGAALLAAVFATAYFVSPHPWTLVSAVLSATGALTLVALNWKRRRQRPRA